MTGFLALRKRRLAMDEAAVQAERTQETNRISYILNSIHSTMKCALCDGDINQKSLRGELPIWDTPECDLHDFSSYRNWGVKDDAILFTLRLLPRLCYSCFMTQYRHPRPDLSLVKEVAKRIHNETTNRKTFKITSIQRQKDLLAILVVFVMYRYASHGGSNHRISSNSYNFETTAAFWRASTVYRHLRRRFGIKGSLCKGVEDLCRSRELFLGKDIAQLENTLRAKGNRGHQYYIGTIHNCYYQQYVWQTNAAKLLCYNDRHGQRWGSADYWPYSESGMLLSFDLFPIQFRLRIYKDMKQDIRKAESERQKVTIQRDEYTEFLQWKETSNTQQEVAP